jgi:WhiB family redox-sensing transcriptional regulator
LTLTRGVRWTTAAACRGRPDLFYEPLGEIYPHKRRREADAKEVCRSCPVRKACLEEGMNEEYGIWGGTTEAERKTLRKRRRT